MFWLFLLFLLGKIKAIRTGGNGSSVVKYCTQGTLILGLGDFLLAEQGLPGNSSLGWWRNFCLPSSFIPGRVFFVLLKVYLFLSLFLLAKSLRLQLGKGASQKVATTLLFFDWWGDKHKVAYPYSGILFNHKRNGEMLTLGPWWDPLKSVTDAGVAQN